MIDNLFWVPVAFIPAILVVVLGLRAIQVRRSEAWADFSDVATVLEWFAAPMIVVAVPLLAKQRGYTNLSAGLIGTAAILLFFVASSAFSPQNSRSSCDLLRRIAAGSGAGLGIGASLLYTTLTGRLFSLVPSASLFISLVWASFFGQIFVGFVLRNEFREISLGPGELLDRVNEIAGRRGVKLEQVTIIRNVPGCSECINAVAMHGTEVSICGDLIARLNKVEVDAVVEHEIGHIADERVWTLDKALRYGSFLLLLSAIYATERHIRAMPASWSNLLYVMWAALYILPEVFSRWYSRRIERRANENVGYVTDPLCAVSGYYKLAVLNHTPIVRPWWSRVIATHPYADEEIRVIANRAGLTDTQVQEVCRKAEEDMSSACGEGYELVLDENDHSGSQGQDKTEETAVKRPGLWSRWHVAALSFTGGAVFAFAGFVIAADIPENSMAWIPMVVGLIGCGVITVVPIEVVRCRQLKHLRKEIEDRLLTKYGSDTFRKSVVVDAAFPGWENQDQPWQGALLRAKDEEIVLWGEVVELHIFSNSRINVTRWTDINSSGADARMVTLKYLHDDTLRTVLVRTLPCGDRYAPSNWKQLENHIKSMLTDAGISTVSLKEL